MKPIKPAGNVEQFNRREGAHSDVIITLPVNFGGGFAPYHLSRWYQNLSANNFKLK